VAARRVFNAIPQRCRIHWMRNALAHVRAALPVASNPAMPRNVQITNRGVAADRAEPVVQAPT